MANKSDDDYWFSSDTKAFNFEDESLSHKLVQSTIKDNIKKDVIYTDGNELTDEFHRSDIPIYSIISQQYLDKLLPNVCSSNTTKCLIEQTVNNMLLNLPYSLQEFKSLQNKIQLLDSAINIADGNAILTVVLFLLNTLKKDIFYRLLSSKRAALLHYINYLSIRLNTKELSNLLMLTGYSTVVGIKIFQTTIYNSLGNDDLKKKLELLFSNHFSKFTTDKDNQIMKNYIELLEWQQNVQKLDNMSNICGQSVNKSLATCYQYYKDKTADHLCSIQYLSKSQGISERQLHWIILEVKTINQSWDEIQKMFIKNNWFGTRKVMTCSLSTVNVAILLGERKAPSNILERFLALLEDQDQALTLAIRYRCHQFVIKHYSAQKNRTALQQYKTKLTPQSDHYFYLENVLLSLDNK